MDPVLGETWPSLGIDINAKKNVGGAELDCNAKPPEIQGAHLHMRHHWLGSSTGRRLKHMGTGVTLLMQSTICMADLERQTGFHS